MTGRTAILLSLLAPLTYIFYPNLPDPLWWQRYRAVMIFGPPLIFTAWSCLRLAGAVWRDWRAGRSNAILGR